MKKKCETLDLESQIVVHFKEAGLKLELEENRVLQIAKLKQKQEYSRIQIQKKHVSQCKTENVNHLFQVMKIKMRPKGINSF